MPWRAIVTAQKTPESDPTPRRVHRPVPDNQPRPAPEIAPQLPDRRRHARHVLADGRFFFMTVRRREKTSASPGRNLPEKLPADDPGRKGRAAARLAYRYSAQYKACRVDHGGGARRAHGLCAEHPQVHRLPALRPRLCRGEQTRLAVPARAKRSGGSGPAHGAR